jgi:hypothetical protein
LSFTGHKNRHDFKKKKKNNLVIPGGYWVCTHWVSRQTSKQHRQAGIFKNCTKKLAQVSMFPSEVSSLGHSEPAPTSAPSRMDDM